MIDNYTQVTALVERMTAIVPIPARPTRQVVDLLCSKGVSLGADLTLGYPRSVPPCRAAR